MVVSPEHDDSRRTMLKQRSPKRSKLKQRSTTWEKKRSLAMKRLLDLESMDKNDRSIVTEMPIVCHSPTESPTNDVNSSVGVSDSAMERAEEVRANLPPLFPSFLKLMLKSHVTGGFWLGLPKNFCIEHLPDHDEMVVLVDENEEESYTKYLADKNGLSGGWRGFSIAHNLLDEDVLIFQLVGPCKFKVYIVRARSFTDIDGVTSLLNLNCRAQPINEETATNKYVELVHAENDDHKEDMGGLVYLSEAAVDQAEDNSDNSASEIMDGIRFSESVVNFKDVKRFEDFNIHMDDLIIDAEIPRHLRTKYYELCRSQNAYLHENIIKGLNTKLAAGMISETIKIADGIRSATATDHLERWDRSLKAFEDLGMAVGFLRARIDKLLSLGREVEAMIVLKRSDRAKAEEEMRSLEMKLSDVRMRIEKLEDEIDDVQVKGELASAFREYATAPW